jgi:glucokinase
MVGVELRESAATAVLVDEGGAVAARAEVGADDPKAAAVGAVERLGGSAAPISIGIAAFAPDSSATIAAVDALASRYGDRVAARRVSASGTAAAVAEAWAGAARGLRDVVYFAVGHHVAAGVVRDGEPVTGSHGRAPAAAWLALNPVEREDYRKTGCLESEVAAAGIVRRLVWRIKAGDKSQVQDMVNGDLAAVTVDRILQAARERDGVAISVMRDTAKYLGMGAANLVVIADPEMIVLGGIIASAPDLLLEPVRAELQRRVPPLMMESLRIATASLGDDAAAIGAARLAARQ